MSAESVRGSGSLPLHHEWVSQIHDPETGLRAIIAIHSTIPGPAVGGCRLWTYPSDQQAMDDVLRLSRGMSYKNAMAGLSFGGGKAVIMGPVSQASRQGVMEAFGEAVERLKGLYITAEDVGTSVEDMQVVATRTTCVSGLPVQDNEVGGDPSPYTARGVRRGIEAVAQTCLGRKDLEGLRVAIQGAGHVGSDLCRELAERGALLLVADLDEDRADRVCDLYGAEKTAIDDIVLSDTDVLAPCALGGVITVEMARKLRAKAVAGGANNQLAEPEAGRILHGRHIPFAPDYVINAGGIIATVAAYTGVRDKAIALEKIDAIYDRVATLVSEARACSHPPEYLADIQAERILARGRRTPERESAEGEMQCRV